MGKITGFLEFERSDRDYEPVEERMKHWREFVLPLPEEENKQAGGALHGLRHPLLPHRLSGEQPDPRLERPRLSRQLAGSRAQPAHHQQFSGSHRPRLSGAVRGVLHAQPRRQSGDHQDHRMRDRRPRLRAGLGRAGAAGGQDRKARRDRRLGARRAWLAPSSSRASGTTCTCSRDTPRPAGCCATAFPTSRWRSITSTGASRRWRRKALRSTTAPISA